MDGNPPPHPGEKGFPMAAPLNVEFHFDFGSPNAFLAEIALPAIEQRTGVKFEYVPVLLGGVYKATGNLSPWQSWSCSSNGWCACGFICTGFS